MMNTLGSHKITTEHLKRRAVVYVRQSSPGQVLRNRESQQLQYQLADRARELGWSDVEVVDTDLGHSASVGAPRRLGFDRVAAAVAMGKVGIVLAREVSRLLRTDKDWCQLMEVCQLFDTLIGDAEQIYDLELIDDQLVLGIKGTLSVVELKVLRMRMEQGRLEKARRGELRMRLPTGYIHDSEGRVVKDPDSRIQEAIELIFRKFREVWSIRQTFKWFQDNHIELPVNEPQNGKLRLVWKPATHSFISHFIRNPFYAGVFFYGRRQQEVVFIDGELSKRASSVKSPEDCRVFIRDHHEGYIDWETYEENLRMVQQNTWTTDEAVLAVRAGQGLLTGLIRCGHCGRKLHVRYWGRKGTNARYFCRGDYEAGGSYCVSFAGRQVDERFSQDLLEAISPLGVEASFQAMERLKSSNTSEKEPLKRKVEQLTYEASRAFEQYNEVDARNRLVAAELEKRWNDKLEDLDSARRDLESFDSSLSKLSALDWQMIRELGDHFHTVWENNDCPMKLKKQITRTVVEELIVTLEEERRKLRFIVHWKGGVHTHFELDKPHRPGLLTPCEAMEIIEKMAPRYGDDVIASVLSRHGHRTARGLRWTEIRVRSIRGRHSIEGHRRTEADSEVLTMAQAARYCNVSTRTLERLRDAGVLEMVQVVPFAPWEIRQSDLDSEPIRGILEQLRRSGQLVFEGGALKNQGELFK